MNKGITLKILSVFIAVAIWMMMVVLSKHRIQYNIQVTAVDLNKEIYIVDTRPAYVVVAFEGRGMDLLMLKMSDPRLKLSVKNLKPGLNEFETTQLIPEFPENLDITYSLIGSSSTIEILADRISEKTVKVHVDFVSDDARNFFISQKLITKPEYVKIRGPKTQLNKFDAVYTEKLTEKMMSDSKKDISLLKPDSEVVLDIDNVKLRKSSEIVIKKTSMFVPIRFGNMKEFSIVPQKTMVRIEGRSELLENTANLNIQAYVDDEELKDKKMLPVKFSVGSEIKILDYTPQKVQVIKKEDK